MSHNPPVGVWEVLEPVATAIEIPTLIGTLASWDPVSQDYKRNWREILYECSTILEPQNPSTDKSVEHKCPWLRNFEAFKPWNVHSENEGYFDYYDSKISRKRLY